MGKKSREKQGKKDMVDEMGPPESPLVQVIKIIVFIGTCFILLTPFVISGEYFFPFVGVKSLYFMGLAEIIFTAWLLLAISSPKYRPKFNILIATIGLFLLVQIISSVLGVDFFRSFWSKYERMTGLLMQFHLFAFFLVVSSVFKKKEDWLKIFGVSVAAAIVMGLLNLLLLEADGTINWGLPEGLGQKALGGLATASRQGATLGNSSFFGTYMVFNLFFALYLFFNSKLAGKIFTGSASTIIITALIVSSARAATLSVFAGILLFFLLWLIFGQMGKLRKIGIYLSVVAFVGLIVVTYFIITPGNFLHNIVIDRYIGANFGGRIPVWGSGWQGFLAKPIFGWGPENFEIAFTKYFNPCLLAGKCGGDIWYDRAHNIVFDTLVSNGIMGFLSYLGIFLAVFYTLWRKFFKQIVGFWTAGAFSVILIAYFIQNLTVFDMVNSYMLFFLTLGFVGSVASVSEENNRGYNGKNKPVNFFTFLLIAIIFIFIFMISVVQPTKADRQAIISLGFPLGSQERLDSYKKTLEGSPLGNYQLRDFFAQETLGVLQSPDLTRAQINIVRGEVDFLAQELEKTIAESPWDFRAYLKLGQLYNTYSIFYDPSKLSRAEEVLSAALVASPTNQQGYWALAQTKIYKGQFNEALSLAEQALALEPESRQSNLIVVQIAKIMGDQNLLQEKVAQALTNNPQLEEDIKGLLGG